MQHSTIASYSAPLTSTSQLTKALSSQQFNTRVGRGTGIKPCLILKFIFLYSVITSKSSCYKHKNWSLRMLNDFSKASPFSNGTDAVSLVSALTITKPSSFYALDAVIPMLNRQLVILCLSSDSFLIVTPSIPILSLVFLLSFRLSSLRPRLF